MARRYLIVDDNPAFGENLAEILEDSGAECTVVTAPEAAVELLGRERFDALITDMRMPGLDGNQLIREARRLDPELPVVVVSAFATDHDISRLRDQALLAVLPKPVPVERLAELVGRARRDGVVVVVEDDPALAENLSEALRAEGFSTVTAASAAETRQIDVKPCAAIVDLHLPDARDASVMCLVVDRFPDTPITVITGHPDTELPVRPRALYTKPFDTARLLAEIERAHASRNR